MPDGERERFGPVPPAAGFELYRYRSAGRMRTRGWSGLYWARRTPAGDYELMSVATNEGERPVRVGTFPRESFERLYERVEWD